MRLLLATCLLTSCASLPTEHVGPVTGLTDRGRISCSQAGVKTPDGWIRPGFRVMTVAHRRRLDDLAHEYILVGGGVPAERGDVALYTATGAEVARTRLTDDLVYSVALHPVRPLAMVGCADGSVTWLKLPDLSVIRQLTPHTAPCRVVTFADDNRLAASGGLDGLVHYYELAPTLHGAPEMKVLKEHTAGVESLFFFDDLLYSGARDGKVRVHERGKFVRTYLRLGGRVHALAFHDLAVVAGLDDGRVWQLAWATADREILCRTNPIFSMLGTRRPSGGRTIPEEVKARWRRAGLDFDRLDLHVGTLGRVLSLDARKKDGGNQR